MYKMCVGRECRFHGRLKMCSGVAFFSFSALMFVYFLCMYACLQAYRDPGLMAEIIFDHSFTLLIKSGSPKQTYSFQIM